MPESMGRPLQPVEVWLFRASSGGAGGDQRQVPASGASLTVTFQGATVAETTTVYDWGYSPVKVEYTGAIAPGDTLQLGTDSSVIFEVDSVSDGTIYLACSTPWHTLNVGDRFMVISLRAPKLYHDSAGTMSYPDNVVTINSIGYARFYCPEPAVDYCATGGGLSSPLVFQDIQAGLEPAARPTLNVLDFPNFQAAHDALPSTGGTIFVPAGVYKSTTRCAFTALYITKPVALLGEANGAGSALSRIIVDMENAQEITAIAITILGGCSVRNLVIEWPAGLGFGSGRGIQWYKPGHPVQMAGVTIENVIVNRSPNWSFEFKCDGHSTNYVSKLEMIQCTAYAAQSGGSLFLGGAGTNNNWIERCEFDGPGFTGFHNVIPCTVAASNNVVRAPKPSFTGTPQPEIGDEVFGMGIAIGTTVSGVDRVSDPSTVTLSTNAIESFDTTPLSFYGDPARTGQMLRGHVHLLRTLLTRCSQVSFQGPGTTPALSTDLVSGDLFMRDTYREKSSSGGEVHSLLINGVSNLLLDGLFHQFGSNDSKVLKSGKLGISQGRIANAQVMTTQFMEDPAHPGHYIPKPLLYTDVVVLANATDDLVMDNAVEINGADGSLRDIAVSGNATAFPTIASNATISIPNGTDEIFTITGANNIQKIVAWRSKRRVTLVFASTATIASPLNLKISGGAFSGTAGSTITLVCDGINWVELSRSMNL